MMTSISPNFFVKDIDATLAWYEKLGFKVVNRVPDSGQLVWAMMVLGDVCFMFQSMESLGNDLPAISRRSGGSLLLYIQVKGIRDFFEKIRKEVMVIKGLEKTFYGATEFSIQDLNGYVLTFAEDES